MLLQAVCALASCKPIVTPAWLKEVVTCYRDNKPLPDPAQYTPEVVDEEVKRSSVCFSPDLRRATLFQDRVFYFFTTLQVGLYKLFNHKFHELRTFAIGLYCVYS